MILTSGWNDLVKNAKVAWREGFDLVPSAALKMYDVMDVSVQTSEHSSIDGPGFAKRKLESQRYTIGSPKQGYSITLSQTRIGLKDSVSWEMRKFDKYRQIMKKMRGLGESTKQRMELDATHQFTFGMAGTSYTNMDGETVSTASGDGLAIFSASHTITGSSTTFSNLDTQAFDRGALESMELLFTKMVNNNDMKVVSKPDTIITTDDPTLVNSVKEFLGSQDRPDTSNRAKNVYSGKYKHLILPYLATTNLGAYDATKKNYWMLANLGHTDAIMEISEYPTFKAAEPGSNGEDFDTDDWHFKSSATYDLGVLDVKFITGSTGVA